MFTLFLTASVFKSKGKQKNCIDHTGHQAPLSMPMALLSDLQTLLRSRPGDVLSRNAPLVRCSLGAATYECTTTVIRNTCSAGWRAAHNQKQPALQEHGSKLFMVEQNHVIRRTWPAHRRLLTKEGSSKTRGEA